jgi:fructose/tagatose bisphosphate aldolase
MKTLQQTLQQAESDAVAIGHFNICDLAGLKAAFDSARELSVPVVVGTSEGERDFMGVDQAAAVVRSLRERYEFPIFLNADHTHSPSAFFGDGGPRYLSLIVARAPSEETVSFSCLPRGLRT